MSRITRDDLRARVNFAGSYIGVPMVVEWAYGKPRLYVKVGGGVRELSPRLPISQLDTWLDAFVMGYEMRDLRKGK